MEIEYRVFREELDHGAAYGIMAMEAGKTVEIISDISPRREDMEELVKCCNEGGLSLTHLPDVVEDWLTGSPE